MELQSQNKNNPGIIITYLHKIEKQHEKTKTIDTVSQSLFKLNIITTFENIMHGIEGQIDKCIAKEDQKTEFTV